MGSFVLCEFKTMVMDSVVLTHWGRVTHIWVSKLTIIGSDNGLSPGRRQAIIWTNDGILLIWPLGTNFSEMLIEIKTFSFEKMQLKMSSAKWHPFCLGLNVLSEFVFCDVWLWITMKPVPAISFIVEYTYGKIPTGRLELYMTRYLIVPYPWTRIWPNAVVMYDWFPLLSHSSYIFAEFVVMFCATFLYGWTTVAMYQRFFFRFKFETDQIHRIFNKLSL